MASPSLQGRPRALSDSHYQQKAQELNELINSLRTTGAQFVLDLPTVCVCGNQSAGKSSVMEGLSGIKLPRSSGTCTRCPMEVRLVSQGTFSCSLKLRYEYDDRTGEEREGGVKEVPFGQAVTNEDEVEVAIRRAQKAILNPSFPPERFAQHDFTTSDTEDKNELQFTKNVVVVEITGGPADLTLIDLPGIIRNTERPEDEKYIALIQGLVKSYVRKDNTIIVAAVTCTDDIDNQEVVKLAKEADPDMVRTLGVLTKPDRIADGEEDQWLTILRGGRYALNLGWFVVKNPTQTQLDDGISFGQARELEAEFFRSSPLWKGASQTGRLGTGPLRHSLSEQLVELIKLKLPGMLAAVMDNLTAVDAELKTLPAAVSDPMAEFLQLTNSLYAELHSTLTAAPTSTAEGKAVYRKMKAMFVEFQQTIIGTQPVFQFQQTIHAADEYCTKQTASKYVGCNTEGTDLLLARTRDDLAALRSPDGVATPAMRSGKLPLTLEDVTRIIEDESGAQLPGTVPYEATLTFLQKFQEDWAGLAEECFSEVADVVLACAEGKVDNFLKRFPEMLGMVKGLMMDTHAALVSNVKQQIQHLAEDELQPPFTLNEHYLHDSKTKLMSRLMQVWREQHNAPLGPDNEGALSEAAASLHRVPGFENRNTADLFRTLDLGKDQQALELMATAMAYLKVAAKRFGDTVPMRIKRALLSEFPAALRQEMFKLLAAEDVKVPALMQEDTHLMARRNMLLSSKKCLREARSKLCRFA